jgi:hypothetical protein
MKPLDFVRTPKMGVAMVTETTVTDGKVRASISYIGGGNPTEEKNQWWEEHELQVLDNFPSLLSRNMAHPFGDGKIQALGSYPIVPAA